MELPIQKMAIHLTGETLELRKSHPRAGEPWTETESLAFAQAIEYTNDINFLSDLFRRTPASMAGAYGQMLKRRALEKYQAEEAGT